MRFTPLPPGQWDDRTRDSLASALPPERRNPRDAGYALATLARHPDLAQAYLPLGNYLQAGSTLPARMRELVILRVAHRTGCVYEWTHHIRLGKRKGLSDDDIACAADGRAHLPREQAALTASDELLASFRVSDQTWATLGEHLDDRQRMDLVFTVGGYLLLAMGLNTFGVNPEDRGWRDEVHDTGAAPTTHDHRP
ncbi:MULTISPECIES: carboxymuconolactone decarboxylase family protein [unclassified Mycobacterium]|uniref:carboxymuconolactone decarboxylase family protein n=1 Tax=unclassified Mycobacterium TaxID=2642494 RepID=UPI0029C9AF0B|nr:MULTISPECIES: carboxymuconolactone decarboxylase family protein [unclassified Mycobacterium]